MFSSELTNTMNLVFLYLKYLNLKNLYIVSLKKLHKNFI